MIRAAMVQAAQQAKRDPAQVRLVAISKFHAAEAVCEAYDAGQRDFGENFAHELVAKAQAVAATARRPRWHFTGRLQSNKVRLLRPWVSVVHSVDRLSLAEALSCNDFAAAGRPPLDIFIQVNLAGEPRKGGVSPQDLVPLARAIGPLPGLRLQGLMALPPDARTNEAAQLSRSAPAQHVVDDADRWFCALAQLSQLMQRQVGPRAGAGLSMGMSHDFATAIGAGATLVRIGTAIFGPRVR